jgi:lactate dehydrogenase-like 2-hydroxyacid dehydrogenase
MEQEFKLRQLDDLLKEADKADIITVYLALQRQNYCLTNTVTNLVKKWPNNPLLTTPEEQ